jgi:hypothetical protein
LLIVQTKVFVPTVRPVIAEVGDVGFVTLPVPAMTVHKPVPIAGALPFKADIEEQIVESGPAFATVGKGST